MAQDEMIMVPMQRSQLMQVSQMLNGLSGAIDQALGMSEGDKEVMEGEDPAMTPPEGMAGKASVMGRDPSGGIAEMAKSIAARGNRM